MQQPPYHHHYNNQRKQQLDILSLPPLLDSQVDEITKGLSPFLIRIVVESNFRLHVQYDCDPLVLLHF
jgi:hypothetical protein